MQLYLLSGIKLFYILYLREELLYYYIYYTTLFGVKRLVNWLSLLHVDHLLSIKNILSLYYNQDKREREKKRLTAILGIFLFRIGKH